MLKRTIFKYSVFVAYIIFLLLISELVLRTFFPINFRSIDSVTPPSGYKLSDNIKIGYELRPNTKDTNSAGFRDFEYKIDKDPGVTRIAVVGDSIAYGIDIEDAGFEKTYAKRLETLLNKENKKRFEVLNFGVPGYGTVQIFEHFKDKIMKYKPDIVIYGYWFNDFNKYGGVASWDMSLISLHNDLIRVKNWKFYSSFVSRHFLLKKMATHVVESQLFKRSYFFYYKVRKRFSKLVFWQNTALLNTSDAKYWYDVFSECVGRLKQKNNVSFLDDEPNWQDFYEYWNAFRDLAGYCKEHSVRLILLLTPVLSDFSDYNYLPLHKFMHKLGGSMGIEVLDTLDHFREKYKGLGSDGDMCHFNESGHFIVAEAIEEYLGRDANVAHARRP